MVNGFALREDTLLFNGVVKDAGVAHLALVGLMLVANTSKQTFSIDPDPSFGQGILVSCPTRTKG